MPKFRGGLEPNRAALRQLLIAVVQHLAGEQSRLALWTTRELDLSPIRSEPAPSQSPIAGSDSVLAGHGMLLSLDTDTAALLIILLASNERAVYDIIHVEIEADGRVQFAAYDFFSHVAYGDGIPDHLLESLRQKQVIQSTYTID